VKKTNVGTEVSCPCIVNNKEIIPGIEDNNCEGVFDKRKYIENNIPSSELHRIFETAENDKKLKGICNFNKKWC
jgi:hypothetical protein